MNLSVIRVMFREVWCTVGAISAWRYAVQLALLAFAVAQMMQLPVQNRSFQTQSIDELYQAFLGRLASPR